MRALILSLVTLSSTVAAGQEESSPRRVELYDILELRESPEDFPAVDMSVVIAPSVATPAKAPAKPLEPFLLAVRALLSPGSSIELKEDVLTVKATGEEQKTVHELLALFRKKMSMRVSIEARIFESGANLREGKPASSMSRLSEKEGAELTKGVAGNKGRLLQTPRSTFFNGQQGCVWTGEQMAYIREWTIAIDKNGESGIDPVVAIATTGIALTLRPLITDVEKGELLLEGLELSLAQRRNKTPRVIETPLGTIEDPEIQCIKVSLSPTLKQGELLLLGPFSKPWSQNEDPKVWILLRSRIVTANEKAWK